MRDLVIVVDIIKDVVSAMQVSDGIGGFLSINYEPGRSIQIVKSLIQKDNSTTLKGTKYPLIALFLPFQEFRNETGFYARVKIDKIIIAAPTNNTKTVLERYQIGETFRNILYPCYYEFLQRLSESKYVNTQDPDTFIHQKIDNPGVQEIPETNDFVDYIEIHNLEFILNDIKTC